MPSCLLSPPPQCNLHTQYIMALGIYIPKPRENMTWHLPLRTLSACEKNTESEEKTEKDFLDSFYMPENTFISCKKTNHCCDVSRNVDAAILDFPSRPFSCGYFISWT